jgi:hypothetical protein
LDGRGGVAQSKVHIGVWEVNRLVIAVPLQKISLKMGFGVKILSEDVHGSVFAPEQQYVYSVSAVTVCSLR